MVGRRGDGERGEGVREGRWRERGEGGESIEVREWKG